MNEVEAAGNTPLHNCAYIGWVEGAELLLSLENDLPPGQRRSPEQWQAEIERRSDELHNGRATLVDADEAIARVRARLNKPS